MSALQQSSVNLGHGKVVNEDAEFFALQTSSDECEKSQSAV